ncbi:MAG: chromate efflux transporter [Smithella sp.]
MNGTPSIKEIFFSFFKLGCTAFGGPAMVVHIRKMVVEQKQWLNEATFSNGVALCQMIPGATAMQAAAYAGFKTRSVLGAGASFIGFALPAFLIMVVLSAAYAKGHSLPPIISAFKGLQVIVTAIVANAALTFGKTWLKDWRGIFITLMAAAMFGLGINPVLVIIAAGICGLGLHGRNDIPSVQAIVAEHRHPYKSLLFILLLAAIALALLFIFRRPIFDLAFLMSRIDLFAFGGGFSSLPIMLNEVVHVRGWLDSLTFLDGIALGQITPGPIVITATFIGYMLYGYFGAIIATIFIFLPSFILVIALEPYFANLQRSRYFSRTIRGILYSFVGMLLSVVIYFAVNITWDVPRILLAIATFTALIYNVKLPWIIIAGVIVSVFVF